MTMKPKRIRKVALASGISLVLVASAWIALAGSSTSTNLVSAPNQSPNVKSVTGVFEDLGAIGNLSPYFWSINGDPGHTVAHGTLGNLVNASPVRFVRVAAGADACNVTTGAFYSDNGVASPTCPMNLPKFKAWCYSLQPHCRSILELPGENNNSAEDASIASYIVRNLGFQPTFWTIGNEPEGWKHYGIAWSNWRTTDNSVASARGYAVDLRDAIDAVRPVDPGAQFIGIEADYYNEPDWFQNIGKIDGGLISSVAYHLYPYEGSLTPTLSALYAPLSGHWNVTNTYQTVRKELATSCPTCARLPIGIGEYNVGPVPIPSPIESRYPAAVFTAASAIQALEANLSSFSFFELWSSVGNFGYAMVNSTGSIDPVGQLFDRVFPYLSNGTVHRTYVQSPARGVWSTLLDGSPGAGPSERSILMVSTNLTTTVNVSLSSSLRPGSNSTIVSWLPNEGAPVLSHGLAGTSVPLSPQEILLIHESPASCGTPLAKSLGGTSGLLSGDHYLSPESISHAHGTESWRTQPTQWDARQARTTPDLVLRSLEEN
jgi:hypothetical protein